MKSLRLWAEEKALLNQKFLSPAHAGLILSTESGSKEPYYFSLMKDKGFAFGGIWDINQKTATTYESCAILTTEAVGIIRDIHHRQPVIIRTKDYKTWLDSHVTSRKELEPVMAPLEEDMIRLWPVSKSVNNPANDNASLVENVFLN